jgi:hypothetical protein
MSIWLLQSIIPKSPIGRWTAPGMSGPLNGPPDGAVRNPFS